MKNKNLYYTSGDLLQNDSFLRWALFDAEEDGTFWEEYLLRNSDMKETIGETRRIVRSIVRMNDYALTEEETLVLSLAIQKRLHRDRQRKIYLFTSVVAAACVLVFFFLSLPLQEKEMEMAVPLVAGLVPEEEECKDIQIIIGESKSLRFDQDADIKYDASGDILVRNEQNEVTKIEVGDQPAEHTKLIVPKGKRSSLVLSDGTKMWVNSGSVLEFPHTFAGNKREININGEIYLEVARDKEKPFVVNTADLSVEVLGTRFNVSSYSDDTFSDVVLVEGKVEVAYADEKVILQPDQLASVSNKGLKVKRVNVYDYISWKDGLLQFNSEPLVQILTRLSRYYDVKITCEDSVKEMKCNGKLVLFDDISQVLRTISHTIPVKYEIIDDNEIIISKK